MYSPQTHTVNLPIVNTILRCDSYHPTALKRSLPISQYNRVRRICSTEESFQQQSQLMEEKFKQRGYPNQWIQDARQKVNHLSQTECLKTKAQTKPTQKRPRCFMTYSPVGKEIEKILKTHWHIMQTDNAFKSAYEGPPQIVYKRAPNIRSWLVKSEHSPPGPRTFLDNLPKGNLKCGSCAQCNFTTRCESFKHPHTGKEIKIKGTITCSTNNVIYLLTCPCGLAYVGQTSRALKTRISEHRSNIRLKNPKSPVAQHFSKMGHNVAQLRYIGIERVPLPRRGGDIHNLLDRREAYWIYQLRTLQPDGLNEDFELSAFL